MENFFVTINWPAIVPYGIFFFTTTYVVYLMWRHEKMKTESLTNLESLTLNEAGLRCVVRELKDDKVLLEIADTSVLEGYLNTEYWFKSNNIPKELLCIGTYFKLIRQGDSLGFETHEKQVLFV
jgi:hypothetical protein